MRTFEFRAWHKKDKRMLLPEEIYGFTSYEGDGKINGIILRRTDDNYDDNELDFPEDIELMQYTGIKDKLGRKIFEGDILLIPKWTSKYTCEKCGYHPTGDGIAKVVWVNESYRGGDFIHTIAQFRFKIDDDDYELDDAEQYEVIGNTFENPELLPEL